MEYAGPGSDAYARATSSHNSSGSQHPALAEGRLGDADSLEPADPERLAAIKAELDPGDVIAASLFLRDRNGTTLTAAR